MGHMRRYDWSNEAENRRTSARAKRRILIRVYEVQEFQFIPLALRLVALVQPSSCGIERVFSQLKLILDACGENVLESTLQCRLFERCGCTGFPLHVELH